MQKIQAFSGEIESIGSTAARATCYPAVTSATLYASHTDFINTTIAAFLTSCGVSAAYTSKDGESNINWLWIEGIPFLFYETSASTSYGTLYHPGVNTAMYAYSGGKVFAANNSTAYNFRLGFAGDPNGSWYLRIGAYNSNSFNTTMTFRFFNATNICTGRNAAFWFGGAPTITNGTLVVASCANLLTNNSWVYGVDDLAQVSTLQLDTWNSHTGGTTKFSSWSPAQFPLIPVTCGPLVAKGAYKMIGSFGIAEPAALTVDSQTEVSIGNKRFIVTTPGNTTPGNTHALMGLLEVA